MVGSVAQFPDEMGRIAVENAVHAIKGEAIVPETKVRIELITRENVK